MSELAYNINGGGSEPPETILRTIISFLRRSPELAILALIALTVVMS